jgi:hypothetical protein
MSTKPQVYTMFGVGALTVWPDGTAVFKEAGPMGEEFQVSEWEFDHMTGELRLSFQVMPGLEYVDIEVKKTTVIHLMPLPVWNVVRLPKRQLGIQCPRKKCKGKAVVTRDWLKPIDGCKYPSPDVPTASRQTSTRSLPKDLQR